MTELAYDKDGVEYKFNKKSGTYHPNVAFNQEGIPHTFNIKTDKWEPQLSGDQAKANNEGVPIFQHKSEILQSPEEKILSGIANGENSPASLNAALVTGVQGGASQLTSGAGNLINKASNAISGSDGNTSVGDALINAGKDIAVSPEQQSIIPDTLSSKVAQGAGQMIPSLLASGGVMGIIGKVGISGFRAMMVGTAAESAVRNASDKDLITYAKHLGPDVIAGMVGGAAAPLGRLAQGAVQGVTGGALTAANGGDARDIVASAMLGAGLGSLSKRDKNAGFKVTNKIGSKIKNKFTKKDNTNESNRNIQKDKTNNTQKNNKVDVNTIDSNKQGGEPTVSNKNEGKSSVEQVKNNSEKTNIPAFKNLLSSEGEVPVHNTIDEAKAKLTPETIVTEHPQESGKYAIANKGSKAHNVLDDSLNVSGGLKNVENTGVKKHSVELQAMKEKYGEPTKQVESKPAEAVKPKEVAPIEKANPIEEVKPVESKPKNLSSKQDVVKVPGHDIDGLMLSKGGKGKTHRQFQSELTAKKAAGDKYDVVPSPKNNKNFALKLKPDYVEPVAKAPVAATEPVKHVMTTTGRAVRVFGSENVAKKTAAGIGNGVVVPHPTKSGKYAVEIQNAKPDVKPVETAVPKPVKIAKQEPVQEPVSTPEYKYKGVSADEHISEINKAIKKIDSISRGISDGSAGKIGRTIQARIREVAANDPSTAEKILDHTLSEQSRLMKGKPISRVQEKTMRDTINGVVAEDSSVLAHDTSSVKSIKKSSKQSIIEGNKLKSRKSDEAPAIDSEANKIDSLSKTGLDMPTMVALHEAITGHTIKVSRLGEDIRGLTKKIGDHVFAVVNADMSKDIPAALKTIAHEIGHVIDFIGKDYDGNNSRLNTLVKSSVSVRNIIETTMHESSLTHSESTSLKREIKLIKSRNASSIIDSMLNKKGLDKKYVGKIIDGFNKTDAASEQLLSSISEMSLIEKKSILNSVINENIPKDELKLLSGKNASDSSIAKLHILMAERAELINDYNGKTLRRQAVKLSNEWRKSESNSVEYKNYREDPNEITADVLSMLINDREGLRTNYPDIYNALTIEALNNKHLNKAFTFIDNTMTHGDMLDALSEGYKKTSESKKSLKGDGFNILTNEGRDNISKNTGTILFDKFTSLHNLFDHYGEEKSLAQIQRDTVVFSHAANMLEVFNAKMNDANKILGKNIDNKLLSDIGSYKLAKLVVGQHNEKGYSKFVSKGMGYSQAVKIIEDTRARVPDIDKFDAAYRDAIKILTDEAKDSGIFTKEMLNTIKNSSEYYTPLLYETHLAESLSPNAHSIGGFGDVENPLVTGIDKAINIYMLGEHNKLKVSFIDMALNIKAFKKDPELMNKVIRKESRKDSEIESSKIKKGFSRVILSRDGITESWIVKKEFADALALKPKEQNALIKGFELSGKLFNHLVTTSNIAFIAKAFVQDASMPLVHPLLKNNVIRMYVNMFTKSAYNVIKDEFKPGSVAQINMMNKRRLLTPRNVIEDGLMDIATSNDIAKSMRNKYEPASTTSKVLYNTGKAIASPVVYTKKVLNMLSTITDRLPKVALDALRSDIKRKIPGTTDAEIDSAILNTIGSPDYLKSGTLAHNIGLITPFFNARVQSDVAAAKMMLSNPIYILSRAAITTGSYMVFQTLAHDNMLGQALYDAFDVKDRDVKTNIVLPIPGTDVKLSLNIPFLVRALTTPIHAITKYLDGTYDEKDFATSFIGILLTEVSFNLAPPIAAVTNVAPAIGNNSNIADHFGNLVVPKEVKASGEIGVSYLLSYAASTMTGGWIPRKTKESDYLAGDYRHYRIPLTVKKDNHRQAIFDANKATDRKHRAEVRDAHNEIRDYFKNGDGNINEIHKKYVTNGGIKESAFKGLITKLKIKSKMHSEDYNIYQDMKSFMSHKSKSNSDYDRIKLAFKKLKNRVDIYDRKALQDYYEKNNYPYKVRMLRAPKGI